MTTQILPDVEIVRALHQYTRRKSGLQHLSKVPISLLCQTIDLIDRLAQENQSMQTLLAAGNKEALQAEGKHPAPCARFCEQHAFNHEIRLLKRQLQEQQKA